MQKYCGFFIPPNILNLFLLVLLHLWLLKIYRKPSDCNCATKILATHLLSQIMFYGTFWDCFMLIFRRFIVCFLFDFSSSLYLQCNNCYNMTNVKFVYRLYFHFRIIFNSLIYPTIVQYEFCFECFSACLDTFRPQQSGFVLVTLLVTCITINVVCNVVEL